MPFGAPFGDEVEKEQRRREREAAHRQAVSDVYTALQRPGGVDRLLASAPEDATLFTIGNLPALTKEAQEACKAYYASHVKKAAETAIDKRDINALRLALGPELYAARHEFMQQSRENFWPWLRTKCQLQVLGEKVKIIVDYARTQRFPKKLNNTQQEDLRGEFLKRELEKAKGGIGDIIASWHLPSPLATLAVEHLHVLFEQEIAHAARPDFSELDEVLYGMHTQHEGLKVTCQQYAAREAALEARYRALTDANHVERRWQTFQQDMEKAMGLEQGALADHMRALKESRFAEMGLSHDMFREEDGHREALFDYAIAQYMAAGSEEDKKNLLPFIEVLLQHGDKPSPGFQGKLDWPVLSLLFKYLDASTHYSETIRQEMMVYSQDSEAQLAHWWRRWCIDTKLKEERRADTQKFALALCAPDQGVFSDQQLASEIRESSAHARRSASSSLYRRLGRVTDYKETGQLVAAGAYGPEVEMRERNNPSSNSRGRGLFAPPQRSGSSSGAAPVSKEENTDGEKAFQVR